MIRSYGLWFANMDSVALTTALMILMCSLTS